MDEETRDRLNRESDEYSTQQGYRIITQKELLAEYAQGRRDFRKVTLPAWQECAGVHMLGPWYDGNKASAYASYKDIQLDDIDLSGSSLCGWQFVRVSLRGAKLEGVSLLEAGLNHVDLSNASLKGARGSRTAIDCCVVTGIDASGLRIYRGRVRETNFSGVNLSGANFEGSYIEHTGYRGAQLRNAKFEKATLRDVDMCYADLSGANFLNARIEKGVDFHHANIEGAIFTGVDLNNAIMDDEMLECIMRQELERLKSKRN